VIRSRNGAALNPHQIDKTGFSQPAIDPIDSLIDWTEIVKKNASPPGPGLAWQGKIPKVKAGGKLSILAYQVNLDGAGPFRSKIDYKGTGTSFSPLTVTKQIFSFQVKLPPNLNCNGKYGDLKNVCTVRCENSAKNGPFGGSFPVQLA